MTWRLGQQCGLGLMALWLIGCAGPLWAALTGVTDVIDVYTSAAGETEVQTPVAIETNHLTGDYVVCWGTNSVPGTGTLRCTRFDAADTVLATASTDFTLPGPLALVRLEATINDQGQFFALWIEPGGTSYLAGFDSDGTPLFAAQELPAPFYDVSLAVTPDLLWVGGFLRLSPPGNPEELLLFVLRFNPDDGSVAGDHIFIQQPWDPSGECRTSDLASTTSGDVLLTWVVPSNPGGCAGTVWGRTFLQNGTPITGDIQLSQDIGDQPSGSESLNVDPHAVAHDNGEYVVTWFNETTNMLWSAALTFGGTLAVPQKTLMPAETLRPFRVAGYPQNLDFIAVSTLNYPAPGCTLRSRLLFEGDLTPETNIPLGLCSMGFDIAFRRDGDIMLLRWSNPNPGEVSDLQVNVFPRPAEIEVSPVTVTEGDPARGIENYATLTTSLSRPHPLGEDITVNYFTRDNTAFAGLDYQQTSDMATFDGMSGETSQIVQIPIIVDTVYEANELFSVNLSNASNAVLKKGGETAIVTILNDDQSPGILPDCDGGDATQCREIQEMGPGQFSDTLITLTLAEPVDLPITIDFETQQGGPDPTKLATPGSDYVDVAGSLQIPAGLTKASFTLSIIGDDVPEDTETFQVELSAGPFINLPQKTLTVHILDDNLCFLQLDTENLVFELDGGSQPVELTTLDSSCQWSATPDQPWVSVDPPMGSDSQTVQVSADAWDPMGQVTRSAEVTFELTGGNGTDSATVSIDQNGDCSFMTDADSANFPANGGVGTISVTPSDPSCDWFVFTDQPWINISAPTSTVTGSGTVHYTVSENGSVNVENGARMAMLMSDEFDFQVTQDGCVYDVDPAMVMVDAAGNDAVDINVMAGPSVCQWTAVSNSVWTIIASGASGGGGGTVRLDVIENPSVVPRIGSVSIADEMVTVNQDGQPCQIEASPESLEFCPDGDGFVIDVTAAAGCEWSLMEAEDWISILSNPSGSGAEMSTGLVDANLNEAARAANMALISTESGLPVDDVEIQQQGFLEYEPFDGPLPPDWMFDPMGAFSTAGGNLLAALSGGGIGQAVHQNPMGTCSDCKVETTMEVTSVTSQSREVATLLGWYLSDNEFIGFGMDEFANTWNLYQVSGGAMVASNSVMVAQILPNQPYHVAIRYDGTTFRGYVDGLETVSMARDPGTDPLGYAGFRVNGSNAQFTELRVTGTFQDAGFIMLDSFEDAQPGSLSVCTQQ